MGSVVIERQKAVWRDRLRCYEVLIDGERVAELKSGESARFNLSRGQHDVQLKIDWCRSKCITVEGDHESRLVCKAGAARRALADIIVGRKEYIDLSRA